MHLEFGQFISLQYNEKYLKHDFPEIVCKLSNYCFRCRVLRLICSSTNQKNIYFITNFRNISLFQVRFIEIKQRIFAKLQVH